MCSTTIGLTILNHTDVNNEKTNGELRCTIKGKTWKIRWIMQKNINVGNKRINNKSDQIQTIYQTIVIFCIYSLQSNNFIQNQEI